MLLEKRDAMEANAEQWAKSFSGECRKFCEHTAEEHSGARWHLACAYLDALEELRERRAADLTGEDRASLEDASAGSELAQRRRVGGANPRRPRPPARQGERVMGRCRHREQRWFVWWRNNGWYPWYLEADGPKPGRIVCTRCGTWLPLGPANDGDERVKEEIRAAELAAAGDYFAFKEVATPGEFWGYHKHLYSFEADGFITDNAAGYLARQIATHQDGEQ